MPTKSIQISQLCVPDMHFSMESRGAFLSQITPIPKGHIMLLSEEEINDDNPAETEVD